MLFPKLVLSAALLSLSFFPAFSQTPSPASNMLAQATLDPGAYLLLRIDTDDLRKQLMERFAAEISASMQSQKIEATVQVEKEGIRVTALKNEHIEKVSFYLNSEAPQWEIKQDGNATTLHPSEERLSYELDDIRNFISGIIQSRADKRGIKIYILKTPQKDQIFIGTPRQDKTDDLKLFASNTPTPDTNKVHLSFQLMDNSMSAEEAQKKGPPSGSALYDNANSDTNEPKFLLQRKVIMNEVDFIRAQMSYDEISYQPSVNFRLSPSGTVAFAKATQENTGKRFAIVLEGKVLSAPVIRTPIFGGAGMITGNFTVKEAIDLANSLNADRLPVKLEILEERVVGYVPAPK